jgi:hypothetical protein
MDELRGKIRDQLLSLPIDEWAAVDLCFQHAVTQAILCLEPDVADREDIARYFGPPRFPGTTSIGYRKDHPELFQDTTESMLESFDDWVNRSIRKVLKKMKAKKGFFNGKLCADEPPKEMVQKIKLLLAYKIAEGPPLCEAIPQQTYEDIFIRMVVLVKEGHLPTETVNFYREFNAIGHRIAMALIDSIEHELARGSIRVAKIIQLAVLSGYVGINLKSSASAASTLLNRNFVPLKEAWIRSQEAVQAVSAGEIKNVVEHLLAVSTMPEGQFGLESLRQYQEEVIEARDPILLVFFCDDYIESVIDLKRFDLLLDANPTLTVLFVPRNGRYGNDIAFEDMPYILSEPQFRNLHRHLASGRFQISPDGPRSGCIDPRYISSRLIETIKFYGQDKTVIFETKGCRNFEMLQGDLPVPWYAGFNCNRALSIRTVGIDGPPVFLRIPPGLKAYDGFRQPIIGPSPSYQTAQVRFARMTTRQLFAALKSPVYQSLLEQFGDERRLNQYLSERGKRTGLPLNELIEILNARKVTA